MPKKTVLVVDDTPDNITVLDGILRDHYNVKAAPRGAIAVKIARSPVPPDVILLDIMMPEMNGYEVLKELKSSPQTSSIPVIFVSAKNEEAGLAETSGMDIAGYLTKPVEPQAVLGAIEKVLGA
ncbi:MAG: hypothetical protein A2096_10685 [Spirochaetes bacterium GWF1_41_5]|nr:MAG: hypothetical protein A2096_10685 [Spirochaetes bacterium GWF1_41_5]